MNVLMSVAVTQHTKLIDTIVKEYTYQPDKIDWVIVGGKTPTRYLMLDSFYRNEPKELWIVHGKNYYLQYNDIHRMILKLTSDPKAYSIGLHPYTEYHNTLPDEMQTSAGRIVIYKADMLRRMLLLLPNTQGEWFFDVGDLAKRAGLHSLTDGRARLFQLKDQPHGAGLV